MLRVTVGEDCGNAPKKAQLRNLTIAFAEHDQANILKKITSYIIALN
jgi:hypothetical protein